MTEILCVVSFVFTVSTVVFYHHVMHIQKLHIQSLEKSIERLEHNNKFLTLLLNGKSEEFAKACLGGDFK